MWQLSYLRAREIHEVLRWEAEQFRLVRTEPGRPVGRRSRIAALRRNGARIAVGIARRLDPGAARAPARRAPRKVGSV